MQMKKVFMAAVLCFVLSTATIYAAGDKPVDLAADTLEYDAATGVMVATGSVKMIQDNAVMTGTQANYNTKTQEGFVVGGVALVKGDLTMHSAEVRMQGNTHIVAMGDVVMTKGDRVLTGPQVDYYTDKEYAVISANAKVTMPDGTVTSDRLEAFMAPTDNRIVAMGTVHLVSEARNLNATSDQATYYGAEKGKIILSGNAVAVQDNNTLRGNTLTLYLAEEKKGAE